MGISDLPTQPPAAQSLGQRPVCGREFGRQRKRRGRRKRVQCELMFFSIWIFAKSNIMKRTQLSIYDFVKLIFQIWIRYFLFNLEFYSVANHIIVNSSYIGTRLKPIKTINLNILSFQLKILLRFAMLIIRFF